MNKGEFSKLNLKKGDVIAVTGKIRPVYYGEDNIAIGIYQVHILNCSFKSKVYTDRILLYPFCREFNLDKELRYKYQIEGENKFSAVNRDPIRELEKGYKEINIKDKQYIFDEILLGDYIRILIDTDLIKSIKKLGNIEELLKD